jgi:hypothetical protein
VKRILAWFLGSYLLVAVIGRFVESQGAVQCGCTEDCWCRRPVLSTFRWVMPVRHHSISPDEKRALAGAD